MLLHHDKSGFLKVIDPFRVLERIQFTILLNLLSIFSLLKRKAETMKRLLCLLLLTCFPVAVFAAANFPFPQNVNYPYGIVPTNVDADKVQEAYEEFMKLYEEQGNLARIKHDNLSNSVSEGIAYGMLITVYMDNEKNNTQAKFDKLWAYYNNFLDPKGLMNWKINGFSSVPFDGMNSATDAELDAAFALMQAYKQWGDEKYFNDAKSLIAKIAKEEVNENGYLKPGDSWDTEKNISYFSTAALTLFKQASDFDWDKVIANSYSLIKKAQNANTGLIPNWCDEQGNPSGGNRGHYTYDATRTPWRLAWAYSWYGHPEAKETCDKIASWISSKTGNDPEKIVDGYQLNGEETSKYNNATFVGPFACAGMVDSKHQEWVDKCFDHLCNLEEKVYYQVSIKILTLLYLSGNMPDFWNMTNVRPEGSTRFAHNQQPFSFNVSSGRKLHFSIPVAGNVAVSVYNPGGQRVSTAVNRFFGVGSHSIPLPSMATGTYILKIRIPGNEFSRQISIVR
jgi:endo-1,4-beta-D-glucanase Y